MLIFNTHDTQHAWMETGLAKLVMWDGKGAVRLTCGRSVQRHGQRPSTQCIRKGVLLPLRHHYAA